MGRVTDQECREMARSLTEAAKRVPRDDEYEVNARRIREALVEVES